MLVAILPDFKASGLLHLDTLLIIEALNMAEAFQQTQNLHCKFLCSLLLCPVPVDKVLIKLVIQHHTKPYRNQNEL